MMIETGFSLAAMMILGLVMFGMGCIIVLIGARESGAYFLIISVILLVAGVSFLATGSVGKGKEINLGKPATITDMKEDKIFQVVDIGCENFIKVQLVGEEGKDYEARVMETFPGAQKGLQFVIKEDRVLAVEELKKPTPQ